MPFEFGDIVLVRFPFTNQNAFKQRPAAVVSNRAYNQARPDVIIMAITSQLHSSSRFGDFLISDWHAANLLKPSAIKPVFATIEQALVLRTLGTLQDRDCAALRHAISGLIG
jgi:mRNA interferase MazF